MGLVEDHRVPHEPLERAHHLRTLDEVDRRNRHRAAGPGVGRTPRRTGARDRARLGMPRIEAKALLQLRLPLLSERRGGDDQHPPVMRAFENLGDDERRLNRLAEADFVRNQDPGSHSMRDGQGRLELKWEQRDSRPKGRAQGTPGRSSLAEQRACLPLPAAGTHATGRPIRSERFHELERKEESGARVAIRSIPSPHLQHRCADTGRLARHDPALVAYANRLTGHEGRSRHVIPSVQGSFPGEIGRKTRTNGS